MTFRLLGFALGACFMVRAAPEPTPSPRRLTVAIENFEFVPRELSVMVGDTVVWSNRDAFVHTSTSDSTAWSSPNLGSGERFEFVVRSSGRFAYHCAAHPVMHGTLVVRERM